MKQYGNRRGDEPQLVDSRGSEKLLTVSVVIPTYNRVELLMLTCRSILAQSHSADEIIIVDDGSTDGTEKACAELPPPIRYIRQENRGLPAARNAGIAVATGKWIAFCDSDDLWHRDKLKLQLAALNATGAGWSITDFSLIDPDGHRIPDGGEGFIHAFPAFTDAGLGSREYFSRWLRSQILETGNESLQVFFGDAFAMLFHGNVALPSTSIVERSLMARVGQFDEGFRRAEDTEFFHRVAAEAHVVIVMKQLADYRTGHGSMISGPAAPFVEYALRSIDLASKLRDPLSDSERKAFRFGQRQLHTRLAYTRLTSLELQGAREAVKAEYLRGGSVSPKLAAIMLASFLPASALRLFHRMKRTIRNRTH